MCFIQSFVWDGRKIVINYHNSINGSLPQFCGLLSSRSRINRWVILKISPSKGSFKAIRRLLNLKPRVFDSHSLRSGVRLCKYKNFSGVINAAGLQSYFANQQSKTIYNFFIKMSTKLFLSSVFKSWVCLIDLNFHIKINQHYNLVLNMINILNIHWRVNCHTSKMKTIPTCPNILNLILKINLQWML